MDSDDDMNRLASLKQSIAESDACLRETKQTIEAVDARLKLHSHDQSNSQTSNQQK
jgi:hypothetical protein